MTQAPSKGKNGSYRRETKRGAFSSPGSVGNRNAWSHLTLDDPNTYETKVVKRDHSPPKGKLNHPHSCTLDQLGGDISTSPMPPRFMGGGELGDHIPLTDERGVRSPFRGKDG